MRNHPASDRASRSAGRHQNRTGLLARSHRWDRAKIHLREAGTATSIAMVAAVAKRSFLMGSSFLTIIDPKYNASTAVAFHFGKTLKICKLLEPAAFSSPSTNRNPMPIR
jgi:hypothetical protein